MSKSIQSYQMSWLLSTGFQREVRQTLQRPVETHQQVPLMLLLLRCRCFTHVIPMSCPCVTRYGESDKDMPYNPDGTETEAVWFLACSVAGSINSRTLSSKVTFDERTSICCWNSHDDRNAGDVYMILRAFHRPCVEKRISKAETMFWESLFYCLPIPVVT